MFGLFNRRKKPMPYYFKCGDIVWYNGAKYEVLKTFQVCGCDDQEVSIRVIGSASWYATVYNWELKPVVRW